MSISMVCRWGNVQDLDRLLYLEKNTFVDAWSKQQLLPELENNQHVLLLEKNNEVIGYAIFWVVLDELQLHRLALLKDYRGIRLGDLLWQHLLEYCRQNTIQLVTLEVRESNWQAQKFYLRNGFQIVGKRPKYYKDNGETALLMNCMIGTKLN